jgi:Helix-turn-helix domain
MAVDSFRSATVSLEPYVDSIVAGKFLGLHPVTVMRLAREGHLPGHPLRQAKRKQWRFLLSELSSWLARQTGTQ